MNKGNTVFEPGNGVVFDLDGTLVDSAPDLRASMNKLLAEHGAAPLDPPTLRSFIGNGVPTLVRRSFAARDLALDDETHAAAVHRFHAFYDVDPAGHSTLYPGVLPLLEALAERDVPMGLCTNKYEAGTRLVLDAFGLSGFFRVVVGGDTLPVLKPDPAPLRRCVEALGAPGILYVGDSEVDAATAEAAGVPFALFTGGYRRTPAEQIPAAFRFDAFETLAAALLA
jgi:phosphoglycolate phosphatase